MEACTVTPAFRADSWLPRRVASFSWAALVGSRLHCACSSKQRSKTWNAAQASLMNGSSEEGPAYRNEQEVNVLEDIAVLVGSCEQLKAMIDSSSSSGVGPDMRNRVEHLLKRVSTLKATAEVAARVAGGRVPSQLIASLKTLQREHGSIENIVRLATQAGPVLIPQQSGLSVVAPSSILSVDYKAHGADVELAQSQENELPVEVLSGPKYVMSTPMSEDSFKVTAVRAEIERRVMEQLIKKQGLRSILESRQDAMKENERKIDLQKVSGEKQRSLRDEREVDNSALTGKGFFSQMLEAQQVGFSTPSARMDNENKVQSDSEQREVQNAKGVPLDVQAQWVTKFESALFDIREQLSEVTDDLRKREDTVLALKEKLMNEQSKLLEKINELSSNVMERLTAEQLNHTLGNLNSDMEEQSKHIVGQLACLSSELHKTEKMLAGCQDEQERVRQELQAGLMSLEGRLRQREVTYEAFDPQSALAELGSLKEKLSALQEGQVSEQSQLADWQAKLVHFERSVWSNSQQLKHLTSEVECRVREEDVRNMLEKVLDAVGKHSKQLQEHVEHINAEQVRTASSLSLLQQDWSVHRRELQTQIDDLKDQLLCLESTQRQGVLTELSTVNERLSHMQEEQKHQRSMISETQQQMVALEGKWSDLLREMSEDAEAQKQDLLKEVQIVVNEFLKSSSVCQRDGKEGALSIDESNAIPEKMGHSGDLVNPSSNYVLSSESSAAISISEQHETLQGGAQQVRDKGTASLEAFFSVMGQLIREELKRMDGMTAQSLPLPDFPKSGEPTQDGEIIVLQYYSSWKKAFIHFRADNLGWTDVPGVPMQEAKNHDGKSWKELRIKAARLEFVVTDGQGNWDQAPNGHNYIMEKPGIYELGAGVLKLVSTR